MKKLFFLLFPLISYSQSLILTPNPFGSAFRLSGFGSSSWPTLIGNHGLGTSQSPLPMASNQRLFEIIGGGYDGSDFNAGALIRFSTANQDWTTTNRGSIINFATTEIGSTVVGDRMTISENGNVKIGCCAQNVQAKLEIDGDVRLLRSSSFNPTTNTTYDPINIQRKSYILINPSSGVTATIKGFSAAATGTLLYVVVGGSGTVIFQDESASNASEHIITNNGENLTITGRGSAVFIYDSTWRLVSFLL